METNNGLNPSELEQLTEKVGQHKVGQCVEFNW